MAEEQVALLRRWGAPSALGRRCGWPASCAARTASPLLREAVELLVPAPGRRWSWRAPSSRSAAGRDGRRDEAVPLLRAAAAGAR